MANTIAGSSAIAPRINATTNASSKKRSPRVSVDDMVIVMVIVMQTR